MAWLQPMAPGTPVDFRCCMAGTHAWQPWGYFRRQAVFEDGAEILQLPPSGAKFSCHGWLVTSDFPGHCLQAAFKSVYSEDEIRAAFHFYSTPQAYHLVAKIKARMRRPDFAGTVSRR